MAVIRDIIPAFELYQPASIDDALRLLDKFGADALVLAGGLDSMDWLKDRLKRPKAVVDLAQIKELHGIREANGGLEIGAMTPLTEVVKHPVVREKFSILIVQFHVIILVSMCYFCVYKIGNGDHLIVTNPNIGCLI